MKDMGDAAFKSPDAATRERALDWIDKAPGTSSWDAVRRLLDAASSALSNLKLPWLEDYFRNPYQWKYFREAVVFRDPLMLDLDGDGLELKAADGAVLFDHDADGVRTGTGWLGADDAILVRDLDRNGFIDTGRELFGDQTLKADGEYATQGFEALAQLDSNRDGQFTSADLAWREVQAWRDLDQDGVSDTGELFSLEALGIQRIAVTGSTGNAAGGQQAGMTIQGNRVAQSATFTRVLDGVATQRSTAQWTWRPCRSTASSPRRFRWWRGWPACPT